MYSWMLTELQTYRLDDAKSNVLGNTLTWCIYASALKSWLYLRVFSVIWWLFCDYILISIHQSSSTHTLNVNRRFSFWLLPRLTWQRIHYQILIIKGFPIYKWVWKVLILRSSCIWNQFANKLYKVVLKIRIGAHVWKLRIE